MAFDKTPAQSTYQTKPIKLLKQVDKRDSSASKDSDYLNCFFEVIQNRTAQDSDFHVVKRAGLADFGIPLQSSNVRGLYYWEDQIKLFVAVDNDIQVFNAATGASITTLNNVFGTSSGEVGFTEFYYDDTTVKVVATDGTTLITIDTANTVVAAADPDMPVHLPYPIFLDGYLFLAKTSSNDIYNSDLNNPLTWTAGNFISAEMFPDGLVRLAKLNNYLVAFGSHSIEYFWDAANASGSPLQRNDTPVKLVGYIGGFAQNGNFIYFMGSTVSSSASVYVLEDFKIEEITTETVRRYLESLTNLPVIGSVVSTSGHDFYVLNAGTLTYVYDIKTKLWTRWGYKSTSAFKSEFAVRTTTSDTVTLLYINGENQLYKMTPTVYQDDGTNYTMSIVTDKEYFETYNQKMMSSLAVLCDKPTASAPISVSWTDDDYQTYSTPLSLELNQEIPRMYRLGRFRRRAFKFEFTQNQPLRIQSVEVNLNMGQS